MPAQGSQVRLLIADDHTIFAQTLRAYLEKTFRVVGVVADGRALVDEAVRLQPDLVIVDIGMPLLNGFDAARRIKEQAPKIKLVFLTMQVDPNLAAAALELGPIGFVLKHGDESELLKAIDYVLRGESYLTPKVRAEDWFSTKAKARQFSKEMTQRQRDIVQLLAESIAFNSSDSSPCLRTNPIGPSSSAAAARFGSTCMVKKGPTVCHHPYNPERLLQIGP